MKRGAKLAVPVGIVMIIVMLVVPLPAALLDVLIAANIAIALLVLLVSMFITKPLDFASFPAVLLVLTLFRLALNISATRLVLLDGHAGEVIETFGNFVVGGSLVVGIIVFAILVVIQFVVITNGAGRVAEVGARFTLDAMPGKQMAIDADLNSGLINEEQARARRREIAAEADFYGAMDGSSKFVKGDAIAAIVITLVNLLGGFAIGVAQKGMEIGEAIETYSLLSIGDGLVSQIPALLLSVATGLIVTRSTSGDGDTDMGSDILNQLGRHRVPLQVAGGASIGLCLLIPALPKIPFLLIGGLMLLAATRAPKDTAPATEAESTELVPVEGADSPESMVADAQVDPIRLELSGQVIDLVDARAGGDLLERVKSLRKKVASDLGIVMPPVRTRDNLTLGPGEYAISLFGVEVSRGQAPPGSVLAVGDGLDDLPGQRVIEPVFGVEAKWIAKELRAQAEVRGMTVIDRASLITTHLADIVRKNAGRLLGREEVKVLTEVVKASHPTVIEELTPAQLSLGEVQRVLQCLLNEGVAIRDLVRIFEALSLKARDTKEPEALVEHARVALGAAIATPYIRGGELHVVSLDPRLEHRMLEAARPTDAGSIIALDPDTNQAVLADISRLASHEAGPVLVCAPQLRPAVRRLVESAGMDVAVLSYRELPASAVIVSVGVVSMPVQSLSV